MCQNDVKCLQTFKLRLHFLLKIVTHEENYLPHFLLCYILMKASKFSFGRSKKKMQIFVKLIKKVNTKKLQIR